MYRHRVLGWDREDILEFAGLLYDLYHSICFRWDSGRDCWGETEEELEDYIDPAQFPTCVQTESHPSNGRVWAMDRKGGCLVSLDFGSTSHGYNLKRLVRVKDHPYTKNMA